MSPENRHTLTVLILCLSCIANALDSRFLRLRIEALEKRAPETGSLNVDAGPAVTP